MKYIYIIRYTVMDMEDQKYMNCGVHEVSYVKEEDAIKAMQDDYENTVKEETIVHALSFSTSDYIGVDALVKISDSPYIVHHYIYKWFIDKVEVRNEETCHSS